MAARPTLGDRRRVRAVAGRLGAPRARSHACALRGLAHGPRERGTVAPAFRAPAPVLGSSNRAPTRGVRGHCTLLLSSQRADYQPRFLPQAPVVPAPRAQARGVLPRGAAATRVLRQRGRRTPWPTAALADSKAASSASRA